MSHPSNGLNEVVHQRTRLGILVVLAEGEKAQFRFLQSSLGLTDGNLSRHLQTLEEAGYVTIEKGFVERKPRTWVQITRDGRTALDAEIALLKGLVREVERSAETGSAATALPTD